MPNFQDSLGRTWSIDIDYAAVELVRQRMDVDILQVVEKDNALLIRLAQDDLFVIDVAVTLTEAQASAKGIDTQQLRAALTGEAISRAAEAIVQGISDFSRPPRGQVIRQTWETLMKAHESAVCKVMTALTSQTVTQQIDRQIDSLLATLMSSSGDSPELLASNPGD